VLRRHLNDPDGNNFIVIQYLSIGFGTKMENDKKKKIFLSFDKMSSALDRNVCEVTKHKV
jgi:hypothetical protein